MTEPQQTLGEYGTETEPVDDSPPDNDDDNPTEEELAATDSDEVTERSVPGLFTSFKQSGEAGEETSEPETELEAVFDEYVTTVDECLVGRGWAFEPNKTIEHGKVDQSMLNHVRNHVFFLHRLATKADDAGLSEFSPDELRNLVAFAVVHDYHKLREADSDSDERFDITIEELTPFVEETGLLELTPELTIEDLRDCSVDHHNDGTERSANVTLTWTDHRDLLRLSDAMASSPTPEDATGEWEQSQFQAAFPDADVELASHQIDQVTGVFTNVVNAAIAEYLEDEYGYTVLTIYQDGCVYLAPTDQEAPKNTEAFADAVTQRIGENISKSHPGYADIDRLQSNIGTLNIGMYKLNDADFFYVGSETVLRAVVRKGVIDGDADEATTDTSEEAMTAIEEDLGISFDKNRQEYGVARFVNTIRSSFVDPLIDGKSTEAKGVSTMVSLFDLDGSVAGKILRMSDGLFDDLTSSKWDVSYVIARGLLDKHGTGPQLRQAEADIVQSLLDGLSEFVPEDTDWRDVLQEVHSGELPKDIRAFISESVRVGDGGLGTGIGTTDTFDQYTSKRGGKICTLCSRGVAEGGNKGPMKSSKTLTTLQAGFSNRKQIGSSKPEHLLLCGACRIEFSLRETAGGWRSDGRLFIHLTPDYFFTPFSWELYNRLMNRFTGDARVRIGRLAEAMFEMESPDAFETVIDELLQSEGNGRPMIESLSQDFDHNLQFGSQTIAYFKGLGGDSTSRDTEYQFFASFLGLAISSYTGMRAYVSESPIPELRSRDYDEFMRISGGFTQVTDFYGETVPLTSLNSRVRGAASLIKLGYALQDAESTSGGGGSRNDALFAKYLRLTRNKLLPGSYLLKRIAQAGSPSDGPYLPALMEYAVTLDTHDVTNQDTQNMTETPHSRISRLAELAYDAIRPSPGHNKKPHRIERVFRESVKALSNTGEELPPEDYEALIVGKLEKAIGRNDNLYPVPSEDSKNGGALQDRIDAYAVFFVEEILNGMANGRPSELKRIENNLADGFFGATLREESAYYDEKDDDNDNDSDTTDS